MSGKHVDAMSAVGVMHELAAGITRETVEPLHDFNHFAIVIRRRNEQRNFRRLSQKVTPLSTCGPRQQHQRLHLWVSPRSLDRLVHPTARSPRTNHILLYARLR